jgi:hypothetical protein
VQKREGIMNLVVFRLVLERGEMGGLVDDNRCVAHLRMH